MLPELLVTWVIVASPSPAPPRALATLRDRCLLSAADPKNPWALAHGITALGKDFAAKDGRLARALIVHDFVQRLVKPAVDGGPTPPTIYGFAPYAPDGTPIEPHPNLLTKTFVLSGLPLSTVFPTEQGPVTLADLVNSVKLGFHHAPDQEAYWHDVGWTLDLLSHVLPPNATFTNALGETVKLEQVMDDALSYLELATGDLQMAMAQGMPVVLKRKQGLYGHSCGGLHLVQAVLTHARHPQVRKKWGKRLDTQIAVLFYRLDSERKQYDKALQQAQASAPQLEVAVLTQMLKFYGHFLETTMRLKKESGWSPQGPQVQAIARAKAFLDHTTQQLEAAKVYESLDVLMGTQRQLALDLIGDACHAANGLEGWK